MQAARGRILGVAAMLGTLATAAPAMAQESTVYPPAEESRTFADSPGGWTSSSDTAGACTPSSCPPVTNSYQAAGGVGGSGDGFIRTEVGGLLGVSGEVSGIWQSPAFTYQGVAGAPPDDIQLRLHRRSELSNFVSASDNSATYSVEIVGAAGAPATVVIDNQPLPASAPFAALGPFAVDGEQLVLGQQYSIRITSRFGFGTTAQPGGTVDYDNVAFRAIDRLDPAPGRTGPKGDPGKPANGKFDNAFLTSFVKNNMRNWTGVSRKFVRVLIRCPGRAKQAGGVCRFKLTALDKRQGPAATGTRTIKLWAKAKREVSLPVKPGFRGELEDRDTLLVRYVVRAGKVHTRVFKQLRVVRCSRVARC